MAAIKPIKAALEYLKLADSISYTIVVKKYSVN